MLWICVEIRPIPFVNTKLNIFNRRYILSISTQFLPRPIKNHLPRPVPIWTSNILPRTINNFVDENQFLQLYLQNDHDKSFDQHFQCDQCQFPLKTNISNHALFPIFESVVRCPTLWWAGVKQPYIRTTVGANGVLGASCKPGQRWQQG